MIEHFKPAGHKAPTLTTAIALEETFKPIQRVVRNDKTIGYLFRDVEYQSEHVGDLVLAHDVFRNKDHQNIINESLAQWRTYLANEKNNPYGFQLPSGPLMMELTYRVNKYHSTRHDEVKESIRTTYYQWPVFNTRIDYRKNTVHHTHLDGKPEEQPITAPDQQTTILSEDNNVTTQMFLTALLGRRIPPANTILSTYGTPVELWTPQKEAQTNERALVLGVYDDGFRISAGNFIINGRPARGVAGAQKILNMPGVEVHDD